MTFRFQSRSHRTFQSRNHITLSFRAEVTWLQVSKQKSLDFKFQSRSHVCKFLSTKMVNWCAQLDLVLVAVMDWHAHVTGHISICMNFRRFCFKWLTTFVFLIKYGLPCFVAICVWLVMQWFRPWQPAATDSPSSLHDQPCTNIHKTPCLIRPLKLF